MDDDYDMLDKWLKEEEALGNMPEVTKKDWENLKKIMDDLTKKRRGGKVSRKRGSKIMQGYKAGGKV